MRLNKYIASCGVASRRGADAIISEGRVMVNGLKVNSMGVDIDPAGDHVSVDGVPIAPENKKIYIMLNKPAGVLSTCDDDRGRKTVLDLLVGIDQRIYPVGRLDYDTEGLLLLTNDGDFAYQCTHPKHQLDKTYEAVVRGKLDTAAVKLLERGIMLDGVKTAPAKIHIFKNSDTETHLSITIHEGRNRQVKRMFETVGCRVAQLKRTAIGRLSLGRLEVNHWRNLNDDDFRLLGIKPYI